MKILVISQYFWPENFRINEICEALKSKGHELHVITSLPNVPEGKFYEGYSWFKKGPKEYKGISLERVRVTPRGKSNFLLLAINCFTFAINALFHIPKHVKRGYDTVFVFEPSPLSVALPAIFFRRLTKKKIPISLYVMDIWPQSMYFLLSLKSGSHKLLRRVMNRVCSNIHRKFDTLFLSSPSFKDKLTEQGVDPKRMVYFPNWAEDISETEFDTETANKFGVAGKFIIMFAGNIGRAQGLDEVIEAARMMHSNKDIIWFIVGNGTEAGRLNEKVREYGIEDTVIMPGWQDKNTIGKFLSIASVFLVSLSDNEVLNITLPGKMQTYMKMKKPIIAFMNGEGAKLIEEAKAGKAVPAGDYVSLSKAAEEVYNLDKSILTRMGHNAYNFCQENFDRGKLLDTLEDVLLRKDIK